MFVDVSDLKRQVGNEETHEFAAQLEPLSKTGQEISFPEPVRVRVHLTNVGESILARVKADVKARVDCSRCLESFVMDLPLGYLEEFRREAQASGLESDSAGHDIRVSTYEGDFIQLDQGLEEQVLLSLPLQTLCRSDCRGLCPRCGRNLNRETCDCEVEDGDPRLAVLKDLLNPQGF